MRGNDQPGAKARAVREMFGRIAPRYDLLNHLLSANIDHRWRRVCAGEVRKKLAALPARILDVGCGTGDLAIEFSRFGRVTGCDFSYPMLEIGRRKTREAAFGNPIDLLAGDGLKLPFRDASFDAVVSAFVLRNLSDLDNGLREMRRVLRPGGVLAALEFAMPRAPVLGSLYRLYFGRILPLFGDAVSGVPGAYRYLPTSVEAFPSPEEIMEIIAGTGFGTVESRPLSAGIVFLYLAQ